MKQNNKVNDIQALLVKQQKFMKNVLIMQQKLFELQQEISEYLVKDVRKTKAKAKALSKPDIMTTEQVCEMLGVSPSTLYRMRMKGEIPFIKVAGRKAVSFERKDVLQYMKNNKVR